MLAAPPAHSRAKRRSTPAIHPSVPTPRPPGTAGRPGSPRRGAGPSRVLSELCVRGELHRLHDLAHQLGGRGRRLADLDADGLERFLLRLRGAGGAGHDRAGVAHRLALGGGEARDVADDRLGDVLLDVRRRALFGVAADLADHHDRVGLRVVLERLEAVDVGGADDRVAADAHGRGEAEVAQFVHHLVGQRAGLGDQADAAGLGDVRRDDARVGGSGADEAGAVRADDPGLLAVGDVVRPQLCGVVDRDALGDDDAQADLGVDRLERGGLGERRRDEDHGHVGAGGLHGLGDGPEDRDLCAVDVDLGAGLARVDAADDLGAGGEHALGVLHALRAGHALDDDLAGPR